MGANHPFLLQKKNIEKGIQINEVKHQHLTFVKNNVFYSNFIVNKNAGDLPFFHFIRKEAYILTYIQFEDAKGQLLPAKRNGENKYLMLLHKVTIPETSWGSKVLNYSKPVVTLDKIKIAGNPEEFNND